MSLLRAPFRDTTNRRQLRAPIKDAIFTTPEARRADDIATPSSRVPSSPNGLTPAKSPSPDATPVALFSTRFLLRPVAEAPVLTVVLDLDETLVSNRRLDLPAAILRPFALEALAALRQIPGVELVLWTASTEDTASPVVSQLSVHGTIFDQVIFRNDIWFTEPVHTKDLRLLGRDMNRVVVFDNAPMCCKLNKHNSVLVEDFTGHYQPSDHTLVNLFRIVQRLAQCASTGVYVPEALRRMAEEGTFCGKVTFHLNEQWARAPLWDINPLLIPPHGDFFKILPTSF